MTEAKQHAQGDVSPLSQTSWCSSCWKAGTWFQTDQKDAAQNIQIKVKLTEEVPKRDTSQRDDKIYYKGVDVYGGYAKDGKDTSTIQGNTVEVSNTKGEFDQVFGGVSSVGKVHDNTVRVVGQAYMVWGGKTWSNDASNNKVTVRDSTVYQIIGGYGLTGQGNEVIIENSNVRNVTAFWGELTHFDKYEGNEEKVNKNSVILRGTVVSNGAILGSYGTVKRTTPNPAAPGETYYWTPFDQGNTISINGVVRVQALSGYDQLNIQLTKENQKTAALTYLQLPETGLAASLTNFKAHSLADRQVNVSFDPGLNCCGTYKLVDRDSDVTDKIAVANAKVNVKDALINRS